MILFLFALLWFVLGFLKSLLPSDQDENPDLEPPALSSIPSGLRHAELDVVIAVSTA